MTSSDNLALKFENGVAFMDVNGRVGEDELKQGLSWFQERAEANDNYNICIDLRAEEFSDLSAVSREFKNVASMLRHATTAQKCAIISDSAFVRNSAKVEGAVIPGLEIEAFDVTERDPAVAWLNDRLAEHIAENDGADPNPDAEFEDTTESDGDKGWGDLKLSKVDY